MPFKGPDDDDRRVIIIERDSGIGWAVAFIVLAIAIGFGVIVFMDQQSMIEYKIEKALQEMQDESGETDSTQRQLSTSDVHLDSDAPADVKLPKDDSNAVIPGNGGNPPPTSPGSSSYPRRSANNYSDSKTQ